MVAAYGAGSCAAARCSLIPGGEDAPWRPRYLGAWELWEQAGRSLVAGS